MLGTLSKLRVLGAAILGALIPLCLIPTVEAQKEDAATADNPVAPVKPPVAGQTLREARTRADNPVAPVKPSVAGQTLREARNRLLDLWVKDEAFNARMRQAPVETLLLAGIKLSDNDRARLKEMNWSATDDELLKAAQDRGHSG